MFSSHGAMSPLNFFFFVLRGNDKKWLSKHSVKGQFFPPWCGYQIQLVSQYFMYCSYLFSLLGLHKLGLLHHAGRTDIAAYFYPFYKRGRIN